MTAPHLSPARLRALLAGELPAEEHAAAIDHLESGCETCHALLDDDVLARLLDAEQAPAMRPPPMRQSASWPRRAWLGVALAAAAAALVFVLPRVDTREKGEALPPTVTLQVALAHQEGGKLTVDRLVHDGERLPRSSILLFQVDVNRPAARTLFTVDAAGHRSALLPPADSRLGLEAAGSRQATFAGQVVVFDLADQTGVVRIVAGASDTPIDSAALREAWPGAGYGWATQTVEVAP